MTKKGKFIVLYGINNLGKSTQARLLVKALKKAGKKAEYIKYPIYNLEPAGKLINEYLRQGNPQKFTPREFQLLHFIDRISYEAVLRAKLKKGVNIVAEDYFGTAMAWGVAAGVKQDFLEYLYKFVLKEDLAFLLDGKRYEKAREKKHQYENNVQLMQRAQKTHRKIGKKYGWQIINANLPIEKIHGIILNKIKKII